MLRAFPLYGQSGPAAPPVGARHIQDSTYRAWSPPLPTFRDAKTQVAQIRLRRRLVGVGHIFDGVEAGSRIVLRIDCVRRVAVRGRSFHPIHTPVLTSSAVL